MAEERRRHSRRRAAPDSEAVEHGPAPAEVHPSIASLRGSHRAAHPDEGSILQASSVLIMAKEWPIICPRFIDALVIAGLDCLRHIQYIKLDHHLLTALVERWSPQTNTFHLPVGEMTITLQDVAMILGIRIDGPALVGPIVVGVGRRWESWPDCCDDLLGSHPIDGRVYHDPWDETITSTFRMGQAKSHTAVPLRWLRWTFARESYIDLPEITFWRHVRAYIMFILGCFLIPDTSGSEIQLQYLPLLEDLTVFSQFSIGSAVLAFLYRELGEATRPKRVNIAGCLQLLQVWSWERFHIGRPTLRVPYPVEIDGRSVGFRWNERHVREQPSSNLRVYRDEFDGLRQSQVTWQPYGHQISIRVADLCMAGSAIWEARVPLICWRRVEWHLPDRVSRQFGHFPRIDIPPMEPTFQRVDGRGKASVDWIQYHHRYIQLWEDRSSYVVVYDDTDVDREVALTQYMRWYRSWATLYLLQAPTDLPDTYYSRATEARVMRDWLTEAEDIFQPYFGSTMECPHQAPIDRFEDLCSRMHRSVYFSDVQSRAHDTAEPVSDPPPTHMDPSPSTYSASAGTSSTAPPVPTYTTWTPYQMPWGGSHSGSSGQSSFTPAAFYGPGPYWMTPGAGPSIPPHESQFWMPFGTPPSYGHQFLGTSTTTASQQQQHMTFPTQQSTPAAEAPPPEDIGQHQHELRDRPRQPPEHYTPGSGAIPPRHRRRR